MIMPQSLNRRRFLSSSLAGTSAAVIAPAVFAQSQRKASEGEQLVVGVMGLSRGRSLARSFSRRPGVRLKYACDVDDYRADACASEVEQDVGYRPQTISDFHRILDDPEVDVLVCAAPNHWHAPATILACKAGKHVYVEKPCSHNPWEGEMMVKAARTHNRYVQLGTQRRSGPTFIEAVAKLREGVIGRVYLAQSWYNNLRPSIGRAVEAEVPDNFDYELWQGPAPRRPYREFLLDGERSRHYNWHWQWHWGNGELGNNGVHALDICRWGLGVEFPVRVTSSGGRYRWDDEQETPDTHTVAFEFEGEKQMTWTGLSCSKHRGGSGFVSFTGEEGTLEINGSGTYKIFNRADKLIEEVSGEVDQDLHIENLLTAIRENKPEALHAEIEEGHKSTILCHLGNIAHRTGHTINCRPQDGHILDDEDAMAYWKREYEPGWEPTV
jgi:predicted dehydrogenase